MPQIYDMETAGFTSPPKEGVLGIFFALKNPKASAGFEPTNLGTRGQHASSRPPKPLNSCLTYPAPKVYAPYYIVICDLSGSTKLFHIISQTA
jgi:hypothetical protein